MELRGRVVPGIPRGARRGEALMPAIAIDGPAGAGKATVARALATKLGWYYVDAGAMYRAMALAVIEAGADPTDPAAVTNLAERTLIELRADGVVLDGRPVGDRIRAPDVTKISSIVSQHPAVRAVLVALQRSAART